MRFIILITSLAVIVAAHDGRLPRWTAVVAALFAIGTTATIVVNHWAARALRHEQARGRLIAFSAEFYEHAGESWQNRAQFCPDPESTALALRIARAHREIVEDLGRYRALIEARDDDEA